MQIFHFNGQTIEPLDLGYDDHSGTRIIASKQDEVIIVGRGTVQRTDGLTSTTIAENVLTSIGGGAWLAAETDNETLLLMDTSMNEPGQPFYRHRGLYRVVDDQTVLLDIGSTAEGGYGVNRAEMAVADEAIYFSAYGGNGDELFRVVGNELTEFDINPNGDSRPGTLHVVGNKLFFSATGPNGREAYVLEGDELTLIDINPAGDSDPWFMGSVNDTILVRALTNNGAGSSHRELFAISIVPEPSSLSILLLSIGCVGVHRSRKRASRTYVGIYERAEVPTTDAISATYLVMEVASTSVTC